MASPISNTSPGKRGSEFQERSVRQKLDSKEPTYLERLPYEIKRMVAEHLQSRDDLKNLAEVSANWKDAALEVINLQNMHAAVEELEDLSDLDPYKPEDVLSAVDVYKTFLYHENYDFDGDLFELIDETQLPQLLQTLTAMSTQQVAERFNALKHECYKDIGARQASYDSIDQKYSDLKDEFVTQALGHIISSSNLPEWINDQAVECAARNGRLQIVRSLLANEEISEEGRGWAVKKAAENGHLEVVQFLLADEAEISEEDRGEAVADAAENGHLEIVQFLLADEAEISEEYRGYAVRCAAKEGYLEITQVLLANGAISDRDRDVAFGLATTRGYNSIAELFKINQA